jgi:hypothetical protein
VANPTLSPHLERVAAVLECQISVLLIILRREVNVSAWKADSSPTAGAWKGDARQHAGDDHCRKARRDVNLLYFAIPSWLGSKPNRWGFAAECSKCNETGAVDRDADLADTFADDAWQVETVRHMAAVGMEAFRSIPQ